MSRWKWVALAAGLFVLGAGEAQFGSAVLGAHHDAATARKQLAATNLDVDQTAANLAERETKLASTQKTNAQRKQEQARAKTTLTRIEKLLAGNRAKLANAKFAAALGDDRLRVLRGCDADVGTAMAAVRAGNSGDAADALQNALSSCATVLAAAGDDPPVFPFDFADPFVLQVGGEYYAYSTNAAAGNVQVLRSSDLVHWKVHGDGLPQVASWAVRTATWAPEVLPRPGGRYVMYYTVREASSGEQCISLATAPAPDGPFVDYSTGPLVCQRDAGGSIDPSPFVDPAGNAWLLWKGPLHSGGIWSQRLDPSGVKLTGAPTEILQATQGWEAGTVEAPAMVATSGGFALFYSANSWSKASYATGEAMCSSPAGPCWKPHRGPVLSSFGSVAGPGGASFFTAPDGSLWIAYAAYTSTRVGYPAGRFLHVSRVDVSPNGLILTGR